jgi:hypothetical protein
MYRVSKYPRVPGWLRWPALAIVAALALVRACGL